MSRQYTHMAKAGLAAAFIVMLTTPACAAPRLFSFHVGHSCTCASCAFEAPRELKKLAGVQKTTLIVKDHQLDVLFDDAKSPISALANAIAKLDMGKDSALIWKISTNRDAAPDKTALERVPGIRSVTVGTKAHALFITFKAQPPVTIPQIENVLKEGTKLEGKN